MGYHCNYMEGVNILEIKKNEEEPQHKQEFNNIELLFDHMHRLIGIRVNNADAYYKEEVLDKINGKEFMGPDHKRYELLKDLEDKQQEILRSEVLTVGTEPSDLKNMKALKHESVEYEMGMEWKWWKEGTDAKKKDMYDQVPEGEDPNDTLTQEEADAYRREELVDMWLFAMQELVVKGYDVSRIKDLFAELKVKEGCDYVEDLQYAAGSYRKDSSQENFENVLYNLVAITKKEGMGVKDLYEAYLDKLGTVYDRFNGEVEGREEYENED